MRPILRGSANTALWVGAFLGVASLLAGIASLAFGLQPLIFRSSSMAPAIDAGALAVGHTVSADRIVTGDIVSVVDSTQRRVTHRVTETVPGTDGSITLTLKGDSNQLPDPETYTVLEVDRVFFDLPYAGYAVAWLSGPWGMFLAGGVCAAIVLTFVRRNPKQSSSRRPIASGAAVLAGLGLLSTAVVPAELTDAYFTDSGQFEAGVVEAHDVRPFDLDQTACEVGAGSSLVRVNYRVADPRYNTVWRVARVGDNANAVLVREVVHAGQTGAPVSTDFPRTDLPAAVRDQVGNYNLIGRSKLKGSANWESDQRIIPFRIDADGSGLARVMSCGNVNRPPAASFTKPLNAERYATQNAIDSALEAACGSPTPCGHTSDDDGIQTVEYQLRRRGLVNYCWNPSGIFGIEGYYLAGCNDWHPATVTASLPTNTGEPVAWKIQTSGRPLFSQSGTYTLNIRVTGNSGARLISQQTITFTRS